MPNPDMTRLVDTLTNIIETEVSNAIENYAESAVSTAIENYDFSSHAADAVHDAIQEQLGSDEVANV